MGKQWVSCPGPVGGGSVGSPKDSGISIKFEWHVHYSLYTVGLHLLRLPGAGAGHDGCGGLTESEG